MRIDLKPLADLNAEASTASHVATVTSGYQWLKTLPPHFETASDDGAGPEITRHRGGWVITGFLYLVAVMD